MEVQHATLDQILADHEKHLARKFRDAYANWVWTLEMFREPASTVKWSLVERAWSDYTHARDEFLGEITN